MFLRPLNFVGERQVLRKYMPYELEEEEEEVKVVSGRRACGCKDCWNNFPSGISTVHVDPKLSSFSGKANVKFKISRVYVSLFNPHNIQHLIHSPSGLG